VQAILTKRIPGTYTKPNRIKAYCQVDSVTLGTDSMPWASHDERAHKHVAELLRDKLKWEGDLLGGSTKEGFAFVFLPYNHLLVDQGDSKNH
jgi:hypothetical protein